MAIEIEHDIPIPTTRNGGLVDTLRSMDIGDSIKVPLTRRHSIANGANSAGIKITTRKEDDHVRVWRVS